jgi:SpoVK/Ycf46/Vps4 family AAA+-type ATPase
VAEQSVGYCGADLKAVVAEAALKAFKRRYPQVARRLAPEVSGS